MTKMTELKWRNGDSWKGRWPDIIVTGVRALTEAGAVTLVCRPLVGVPRLPTPVWPVHPSVNADALKWLFLLFIVTLFTMFDNCNHYRVLFSFFCLSILFWHILPHATLLRLIWSLILSWIIMSIYVKTFSFFGLLFYVQDGCRIFVMVDSFSCSALCLNKARVVLERLASSAVTSSLRR